jgi:hypothetical protein
MMNKKISEHFFVYKFQKLIRCEQKNFGGGWLADWLTCLLAECLFYELLTAVNKDKAVPLASSNI